jgi:hypothetical protein
MAEKPFELTFPMYGLLLKDLTGTVFLRHAQDLLLPLFTEDTNVLTYATKSHIGDCAAVELPTPRDVESFVSSPPSRAGKMQVTTIILDPIDNQPRDLLSWNLADFLYLLSLHAT